ncbi:hypothetical protein P389DRAFT_33442 [Cystobasidium minutum MCA 4210]|uniref:uncharacterized protein n=1 Tax=Cystobasidium minutum MCA 4210 TaxID=1397322 RepID=UPI0034CFE162|eukprot:jgi/Rhomi1/33442/CE33441_200
MARSRRASSSVASSINGGQAIQTSPPPSLPQPSSNTVGRFKKASKLATSFLKQLKSPSNSDGEDSDDDDGNDSDLDFGCSGLQDAFDELDELLLADSAELHISLEKSLLQSIQQDGGEHSAQLNLDMPTRSSSIADSLASAASSITRASSSHSSSASSSPSQCTLSTPTSQSQSARSSISNTCTSPSSHSPTKVSFTPGSTGLSSHASLTSHQSVTRKGSTAIMAVHPSASPELSKAVKEEAIEENEDMGSTRRKCEEEAAIDALEAYFAYRKASNSISSSASSSSHDLSSCLSLSSIQEITEDTKPTSASHARNMHNDATHEPPSPSTMAAARSERSDSIPYSSPYFEMYANEPLLNYFSTSPDAHVSSMKGKKSISKVPTALNLAGSHTHVQDIVLRRTGKGSDLASPIDPFMKLSPRLPRENSGGTAAPAAPILRSRRSEASLVKACQSSLNGVQQAKRRPSLANGLMSIQVRPKGYTYSPSSAYTSAGRSSSRTVPSLASPPPSVSPTVEKASQTATAAVPLPLSPASQSSLSPSIYAVSIPSCPSTPAQEKSSTTESTSTEDRAQMATYPKEAPLHHASSCSNFLDFTNSPESFRFRHESGDKNTSLARRKGSSMMPMQCQILQSPPRSTSLVNAQNGMQRAQAQAQASLKLGQAIQLKEPTAITGTGCPASSSVRVNFDPSLEYHQHLEGYKFPDRSQHGHKANSSSSSCVATPGIMSPTSLAQAMNEAVKPPRATMPPKVHTPLGSATASRRGSLVSSPSQAAVRSRAGSIAAGINSNNGSVSKAAILNRNPGYGYI